MPRVIWGVISGGIDLTLEGLTSADDWWALVFEVRQRWPDAFLHRTEPGEMFVYRDQDSFRRKFDPEEAPHDFIRVLMGPEDLTMVIDGQPTEATRVGREVFTVLQQRRRLDNNRNVKTR